MNKNRVGDGAGPTALRSAPAGPYWADRLERMAMRKAALALMLASLALGGCVASIAAGVVGAAVNASRSGRDTNEDLRQPAVAACSARAAQVGTVHIIDAEQRGGRVKVWGTVIDERERRSFECTFNGRVSGFTLRAIRAR